MLRDPGKFTVLTILLLGFPQPAVSVERLPVFVSIVPQKAFVQKIGKDRVNVQVMVQPGASPHTYEPRPRQMVAISKAKLYFAIGVAFEKAWLDKIAAANPKMKVVHTDHGIEKIPMKVHRHQGEERQPHGDGERHRQEEHRPGTKAASHKGDGHHEGYRREHGTLDPHIWLSPPLVKLQARTILNALQEIDPSHAGVYETNYQRFVSGIDDLDAALKTIFAGKQGLQFMVFHPAWGYFAHTYGLEQVPVEIEGKNPKAAQLRQLIEDATKKGIKVVFVQPQFSTKSAELVAREIGGQVVFADPLAANWSANLREVADKFEAVLR